MTQGTSGPMNSHIDKAHPNQAAEQRTIERKRVVTLIGRLLARHWLRHNDNQGAERRDGGSNPNVT